jgi:hypothetical protein
MGIYSVIYDSLIMEVYLSAGVYPNMVSIHDVNRNLRELPPDEARRMRRKFRKLWRKARRGKVHNLSYGSQYRTVMHNLGWPGKTPDRSQMWFRKAAVKDMLLLEHESSLRQLETILSRKGNYYPPCDD